MTSRILDVGQCGFDGPRMAALWRDRLGATVDRCATGADALRMCSQTRYDLVLVNRVLAADGSSGLDVVRDLVGSGQAPPVLLVSDLATAQDQAVALGAVRGFGKAALGDHATVELVQQILSADRSAT
ncbi:MAG: response regulator [Gemmataceae bacterium]|nr:response regulator [Gemmataceae bacterium]